jgi:CRISPR/Cas system-associated exonuclease Cas4 (RecB family)
VIEPREEDIENIKKEIFGIIDGIMGEEFSPTPGKECYNCDYSLLCDEKEKSG